MPENKTRPTRASVVEFINAVDHDGRREDAHALLKLFEAATGWSPRMWGPSLIGFGRYEYTYDSGHSGEMLATGFSPRKANMVLYVVPGVGKYEDLLSKLGKYKTGKSCLYIGRLDTVDLRVLEKLIKSGVADLKKTWPVHAE